MELPVSVIERIIVRGAILHSDMFDDIDHGKFFVIIGVSGDSVAGFFFINSNIHGSLRNKQAQLDLQYPMKCSDYMFLRYDSFLCATNIIKRSRRGLAESIVQKKTRIVDSMKEEHMDEILQAVRNSRLFSKIEKRDFLYEE